MASQSPVGNTDTREYVNAWLAMTQLMNTGSSWSGRERNCCFLNLGQGRFADVSAVAGLDFLDDGRALAVTDWDGDGDLDLWFKNRSGPVLRMMRNDSPPEHHSVAFRLVGKSCNRDGIGAIVELTTDLGRLTRTLLAGDGYLAQSSKWIHFGLGTGDTIERVVVHWPGGDVQELPGPPVDRRYRIEQGSSELKPVPMRSVKIPDAPTPPKQAAGMARVVLRVPLPLPTALTSDLFGRSDPQRAKLINLWAQWCPPCIRELTDFAHHYDRIHAAGLDVMALCLDKPEDHAKARRLFDAKIAKVATHDGLTNRVATDELADVVDAVLRHVLDKPGETSLPTSLLIDRNGALQIVYIGPITVDRLLTDAATYGLRPDQRLDRSPFPGRWYYGMRRNLKGLARDLMDRGRTPEARFYADLERQEPARRSR